jgi:MATE family multidrug resistance protein
VAAHQIALTWGSLTFCVAVGIGAAGSARVGWAVGARDAAGVRRAGLVAFGSGAAFMALSSLLFVLFPTPLARVMSDRPDVVATASALFWVMAVFQLSDGVQAVGAGALRGLGDTRFAFWANFVGHWCVGLPVAWWLGVRGTLGVIGVWWGLSAGLTAVALSVLGRFVWLTRGPVRALAPEA